ncbi:MAG: hypothetical protein ACRCXT_04590 [Paraclostridium sp.]
MITDKQIKDTILQAIQMKVEVKHIKHLNHIGTKSHYIMCLGMNTINIYTYTDAIGDVGIEGMDFDMTNIMYREECGYHALSNYVIDVIEKQRRKSGKALLWIVLMTAFLALVFHK